jgi:photosystem II stability/assembly factor-like uncharacterized protein
MMRITRESGEKHLIRRNPVRITNFIILASFILSNSCGHVTSPFGESSTSGTWEIVREKQDDIYYTSIYFTDAKNGWIVGFDGTIQYTSDGGDTWAAQQSGVSSDLWDIDFINGQTGWICGAENTILKTANAGMTWTRIPPTNAEGWLFTDMELVTADVGWILSNRGEILRTTDGGLSWHLQRYATNEAGFGLFVIDENILYVFHGFHLYRSFDKGEIWDSLTMTLPDNFAATTVFFVDRNKGWANTFDPSLPMFGQLPVLITNDGGRTWSIVESLDDGSFNSIYFINENVGWVVESRNVYKTIDGGDKWNIESILDSTQYGIKDLMFVDERHGWLLTNRGEVQRYLGDVE